MEIATSLSQLGIFEPHGHCFLWRPDLILFHTVSDSITARTVEAESFPTSLSHATSTLSIIKMHRTIQRPRPVPWPPLRGEERRE